MFDVDNDFEVEKFMREHTDRQLREKQKYQTNIIIEQAKRYGIQHLQLLNHRLYSDVIKIRQAWLTFQEQLGYWDRRAAVEAYWKVYSKEENDGE